MNMPKHIASVTWRFFVIGVCLAANASAASKTTSRVATQSTTNAPVRSAAAKFDKVKADATRFDKEFECVPTTEDGLNRLLARLDARGVTLQELRVLNARNVSSDFNYLVSSAMVAHASTPKERATALCDYGVDLSIYMNKDRDVPPKSLITALEYILTEAKHNGLYQDEPSRVGSVVNSLVYNYARSDNLDKAWSLFAGHKHIVEMEESLVSCCVENMANAMLYENKARRIDETTREEINAYVAKVLVNPKTSMRMRYSCEQLRAGLAKMTKGGDFRQ